MSSDAALTAMSDGVIGLRCATTDDVAALVAGRDVEFHRFIGEGAAQPAPSACIVAGDQVVGWIDYDTDRGWLVAHEVNVGYNVFARFRGRGYGTRALQLLMHHLAVRTEYRMASVLIDPANSASLSLAARAKFVPVGRVGDQVRLGRSVPPINYNDGVATLRPLRMSDLEADLAAKDDEQVRWLWLPGDRERWVAMSRDEQVAHARYGLRAHIAAFGTGPKWAFAVEIGSAGVHSTQGAPHESSSDPIEYVAYVDCDLANDNVAAGEANISYSSHPDHRGSGYVSRGVRLAFEFLADHTGARSANLIVDENNAPSLRVAQAVGAIPVERLRGDTGHVLIRHQRAL